jgi:hypothetical protein
MNDMKYILANNGKSRLNGFVDHVNKGNLVCDTLLLDDLQMTWNIDEALKFDTIKDASDFARELYDKNREINGFSIMACCSQDGYRKWRIDR